ncbi:Flp family type IVb pilin [Phenylobacterium hankyongense]|uniref:Flp family type IVb pilin n=1 Tax=Phenylobacterium hankyongense TaxID=1813876 RepID=A0A328B311_9CAUL|nr:Flp family type IVb pilin [Phenylobacterium hankyongense]RAK60811.1 Flp family type IVb pilin [Phenylobacterium hankyongense]
MLKAYVAATNVVAQLKARLAEDRSGAALVEYSVLIGLITVAAVATIKLVGAWIANQWTSLQTAIGA